MDICDSYWNLKNFKWLHFADLLHIYSRYGKKIQSDQLTIVSLVRSIRSLKNALIELKQGVIIGGWEENWKNEIEYGENEELNLKGFEQWDNAHSRRPDNTNFDALRDDIIDSIMRDFNLDERFQCDELVFELIEPFEKIRKKCKSALWSISTKILQVSVIIMSVK